MSFSIPPVSAVHWYQILHKWYEEPPLRNKKKICTNGHTISLVFPEDDSRWEELKIEDIIDISIEHIKAYDLQQLDNLRVIFSSKKKEIEDPAAEKLDELYECISHRKKVLKKK